MLMSSKVFDGDLSKNTPVTLGIDQSLTGFALTVLQFEDPTKYITWVYKSPYFGVERLVDIRQWLIDHFDYLRENNNTILDIAMEGTVLASHAALVLGELSATVRLAIFDYFDEGDLRKYPLKVPPMTLKKFAAGKGNAKKQEMLLQIYKRWGIEFNDDNAADSYALARLLGKNFYNEVEKAVAEQMKDPKYRDAPRL
jgi:Holliday junction resolvasome RuvABC endonuclease subunit